MRMYSLLQSGIGTKWYDWNNRVVSWNDTVLEARQSVVEAKGLSLKENIMVVLGLHFSLLALTILVFLAEILPGKLKAF